MTDMGQNMKTRICEKLLPLLLAFLLIPLPAFAATAAGLKAVGSETSDGYRVDYCDSEGTLTDAADKGYASVVCISGGGLISEEAYFDSWGCPVRNRSGYAVLRRTFDDAGHAVREMYFDEQGRPVMRDGGWYGISNDAFDEHGRAAVCTFLDENGDPMTVSEGYSSVKRSYNEDGRVENEMYFRSDGEPAVLAEGESGAHYLYDAEGLCSGKVYLDRDGQPMTNEQGCGMERYAYDGEGHIILCTYHDLNGEAVALSRGQYGQVTEYRNGEQYRTYYIDAGGKEIFMLDVFLNQTPLLNLLIAVLLVIAAVILPKRPRILLLVLYTGFIVYMTLGVREAGIREVRLTLFWSYRQFFTSKELQTEIINNILLFIPFGALAGSFRPKHTAVLLSMLFSAAIETVQWIFSLGFCELDDVFSNTLGGAAGLILAAMISRIWHKLRHRTITHP